MRQRRRRWAELGRGGIGQPIQTAALHRRLRQNWRKFTPIQQNSSQKWRFSPYPVVAYDLLVGKTPAECLRLNHYPFWL
ncbi:protein of unknown function [Azospirillum lipoferum 4B]|uniref:Uncharacterized protein n=1 Tax=Azospirillum lipoferum (strain 4B) TaxID=862719 RepID=G7Z4C5_AZOL4|nr:protein of unknown function [Azospirillum lipoferum 4B]